MKNILKPIFKIYEKSLLLLLSIIGFSAVANSNDALQPEYGVRVLYGPPLNNYRKVLTVKKTIKGIIRSSRDLKPIQNVSVRLFQYSDNLDSFITDSSGNYKLNIDYSMVQDNLSYRILLTPIGNKMEIKYKSKDTTIMTSPDLNSTKTTINFYLDEKK